MSAGGLVGALEGGNVRVIERCEHLGLALEPGDAIRIVREGPGKLTATSPQLCLARGSLTHAPTEDADDFVEASLVPAERLMRGYFAGL